jgi:hypothetical protein
MTTRKPAILVAALLVALALSGCFGSRPTSSTSHSSDTDPNTSPTTHPTTSPPRNGTRTPARFAFNDCRAFHAAFLTDYDKLSTNLPEGYLPRPTGPRTEIAGLDITTCKTAVFDNQTVVKDLAWSMVTAFVTPPKEVAAPGWPDGDDSGHAPGGIGSAFDRSASMQKEGAAGLPARPPGAGGVAWRTGFPTVD